MRLLALDTTSHGCSVAISDDHRILAELIIEKKETHSKHLMSLIDSAIHVAGMALDDLDAFAVARGPGSFTGLRIGLSTIKGICFATEKPLVGVSSLEALAQGAAGFGFPVCPIIDARKNEVYQALYSFEDGRCLTLQSPRAVGKEHLCDEIKGKTVFIGSGVHVFGDVICHNLGDRAVIPHPGFHHIKARYICEIAENLLLNGGGDETLGLIPSYIRKSDAELNLQILSERIIR